MLGLVTNRQIHFFWPTVLALSFLSVARANAENDAICLSKFTHFDICKDAQNIQQHVAPLLPMKMNSEMTFLSISAIGPRLGISINWKLSKPELVERLKLNNLTDQQLEVKMQEQSESYVCNTQNLAAFVRLGGEIQYHYLTTDNTPIASPIVSRCPTAN